MHIYIYIHAHTTIITCITDIAPEIIYSLYIISDCTLNTVRAWKCNSDRNITEYIIPYVQKNGCNLCVIITRWPFVATTH